jgi:selenocysteine-specific elongation factor
MKSHTIIGTAGHIDHGKTALIKALTGIDADRLKEEQERGITIDIGFAYWKDSVTIIDVPGHEKFIRNMVAGVSTIDFFILVIAADDGIMPQTIEHLDILRFFNIANGIVVINKIDLADDDWLSLVRDDIHDLLKTYQLTHLPVVEVSATKGTHIDSLQSLVEQKIQALEQITDNRPFRLFVDRSFSIKGFGTVVTGTVLSGSIKEGDEIEVIPSKRRVKVRGLQSHTSDVDQMNVGHRAAINLQGIEKTEISRGDKLATANSAIPFPSFSGIIKTVSKITLKVKNGTAERYGEMIWYDNFPHLKERESYHVKIKLERPVGASADDAFLVRSHSPVYTLAGGKIIEIDPPRFRHQTEAWQDYFEKYSAPDLSEKITHMIRSSGKRILSIRHMAQKLFETESEIAHYLDPLIKNGKIRSLEIKGQPHLIHNDTFRAIAESIEQHLTEFHEYNPLSSGTNRQELINALHWKWLPVELVEATLTFLINQKKIRLTENTYALSEFKIQISKNTESTQEAILDCLLKSRFTPPARIELTKTVGISNEECDSLLRILIKEKKIIQISNHLLLHNLIWQELLNFLRTFFKNEQHMPVSALKEFIQTTRKFAIPIFEFLDSEGYTRRSGDMRQKGISL